MNNIVYTAQIVGIISFILIIIIKTTIAITIKKWPISEEQKIDRLVAIILWMMIYFVFLLVLRSLSFFNIGTLDQLRIISGYATVIPLIGVIAQLFFQKKLEEVKDGK